MQPIQNLKKASPITAITKSIKIKIKMLFDSSQNVPSSTREKIKPKKDENLFGAASIGLGFVFNIFVIVFEIIDNGLKVWQPIDFNKKSIDNKKSTGYTKKEVASKSKTKKALIRMVVSSTFFLDMGQVFGNNITKLINKIPFY